MEVSTISHKSKLGHGIYTATDIANILGFPASKVTRYLNNYWDQRIGKEVFGDTYTWSVNNRVKAVNFYVLIELYTFINLQELGVSTQKVFKVRKQIIEDTGVQYPFASAGILSDGKDIWYEFKDSVINTDGSRQTNLANIIHEFAKRIDFNSKDKLAERYYPAGKTKSIVVDPHHQFGLPTVRGTNINTDVIISMHQSGEPTATIGELYDLSEKQIREVIQFYKKRAA